MPQITIFDAQGKIIDCYIVSSELFEELTRVTSIFELDCFPISLLEELERRFLTFLMSNFDPTNAALQVIKDFPWYSDLVSLLDRLYCLKTPDLTIELTN